MTMYSYKSKIVSNVEYLSIHLVFQNLIFLFLVFGERASLRIFIALVNCQGKWTIHDIHGGNP